MCYCVISTDQNKLISNLQLRSRNFTFLRGRFNMHLILIQQHSKFAALCLHAERLQCMICSVFRQMAHRHIRLEIRNRNNTLLLKAFVNQQQQLPYVVLALWFFSLDIQLGVSDGDNECKAIGLSLSCCS